MPYNNRIKYIYFPNSYCFNRGGGCFFLMTLAKLFANEAETMRHWTIILWNWIIYGLWLESMVDDVVGPVLADS